MKNYLSVAWKWLSVGKPLNGSDVTLIPTEKITEAQARELFRSELTRQVEHGWSIEIENEFDAVLSRKRSFNWIIHISIILICLFFFPILAFFWIFVMIIIAITKRTSTKRIWIDPDGSVFER